MFKSDNENQSEATLLHYWRILKKRQPPLASSAAS